VVLQNWQVVSILRPALVIGESSFRLGILLAGPQLSFLICFSVLEGVFFDMLAYWRGFGNFPLVGCPLRWFFCLL